MTSECQKCEEKNEAMTEAELLRALGATQTMPELDALRLASVRCMQSAGEAEGEAGFKRVQNHFIKAKNRLTRIPLRDRTW